MRFRSTCEGEYPDLLRIVWQQWKFAFFGCVLLLKAHLFYFPKNYYWQWEIYVSAQNDFSGRVRIVYVFGRWHVHLLTIAI